MVSAIAGRGEMTGVVCYSEDTGEFRGGPKNINCCIFISFSAKAECDISLRMIVSCHSETKAKNIGFMEQGAAFLFLVFLKVHKLCTVLLDFV